MCALEFFGDEPEQLECVVRNAQMLYYRARFWFGVQISNEKWSRLLPDSVIYISCLRRALFFVLQLLCGEGSAVAQDVYLPNNFVF